ncbi:MAG: tetratricopeptide repeat-containing sensor histidine kinase [Cyclobacteriaceae bacterium]|nr:tetratricopeptide repeat-containing sensor histidine kinase [Cyclobacteriaceae bacterium]
MKHLVFFVFCILFSSTVIAQNIEYDSLIHLLDSRQTKKNRVKTLIKIAQTPADYHDSTRLKFITETIALSEEINYNSGLGTGYYLLGQYLLSKGAYDSALTVHFLSISSRQRSKNKADLSENYMSLGSIHEHQSNYASALEYFMKALTLKETIHDSTGIADCYNSIAVVHKYQRNYSLSLKYFLYSLNIRKKLSHKNEIAHSLNNIGVIYRILGEYQKAREYYIESLKIKLKFNDEDGTSNAYNNIGITYFYENEFDKALEYYLKSLKIREKLGNKGILSSSYLNIGEVYFKLKKYEKSYENLQLALDLSIETGNKDDQMLTYKVMAELEKEQRNFEKAVVNMEKYTSLNESIYSDKQSDKIAEIQTKYEVGNKEREIELLQKENEIISIKEKSNTIIRNTFIIVTVIISILIFAIMRSYWEELANSKLLKKQKSEIELQNKTLLELSHDKDHLMHIVAHDLRSPLNQIEGLVKLISLESEVLTDQQLECIERIKHSTNHSKELLSKILSVRSIESAKIKMKLEKIDLSTIVAEVIQDFETDAKNKKIGINLNVTENDDLNASIDKNFTKQIIDNLLSNAIKFSSPENNVDINLKKHNKKIRVEVIDNGPGIPDDDKDKLFKKYQKLTPQPTSGETSTGLGLSIVKKYIEIMNGKVWHEDNIEKGSKFIAEFNEA